MTLAQERTGKEISLTLLLTFLSLEPLVLKIDLSLKLRWWQDSKLLLWTRNSFCSLQLIIGKSASFLDAMNYPVIAKKWRHQRY